MSKEVIARLQNNIANITSNLEECQAALEELKTDLNRLIDTGVENTSSRRKIKAKNPPPLRIGDFVKSKTRPNKGISGRVSGRTPNYLIVTPNDPTLKSFRKKASNLEDYSIRENCLF